MDQFFDLFRSYFVAYFHLCTVIFESNHDDIWIMLFQEWSKGHGWLNNSLSLSKKDGTLTVSMFWLFSAMKSADFSTTISFSLKVYDA